MIRQAREVWAATLTHAHTRWLVRRDRSPWLYMVPLAAFVYAIGPH